MKPPRKLDTLVARRVADLSPLIEGATGPIAVGFDLEGSVYVAAGSTTEPLAEARGMGIFPKSQLATATSYTVVEWNGSERRRAQVRDEVIVASYVQPTPQGFLLVGARCRWRPEGAEKNAVEFDWSGRELRRFTAGDGIQDVRTTRNGKTWVSYFDEGIFGNFGWNGPGPECVGASGCVCFDQVGAACSQYAPDEAGTDSICDAYAMNVAAEDELWLYFYTQFPIVRLSQGRYQVWDYGVAGAQALAVDGLRVLLFGDYSQRDRLRILRLDQGKKVVVESEKSLTDEAGATLGDARAFGVGKRLYLRRGAEVFALESW